jgi:hypothetical protein
MTLPTEQRIAQVEAYQNTQKEFIEYVRKSLDRHIADSQDLPNVIRGIVKDVIDNHERVEMSHNEKIHEAIAGILKTQEEHKTKIEEHDHKFIRFNSYGIVISMIFGTAFTMLNTLLPSFIRK